MTPRLLVFDCDGTLVDSLHAIQHAMHEAFTLLSLTPPTAEAVRGIVGLSVPQAVAALAPNHQPDILASLDAAFRRSSVAYRAANPDSNGQLYPGTMDALRPFFTATQTADDAPSKPHPGMLENCERQTGIAPERTVMIGDTTFDIQMARAHGCTAIGVSWGYHPVDALHAAGAHVVIDDFAELDAALDMLA